MLRVTRLLSDSAQAPTPKRVWQVFGSFLDELRFHSVFYCSGVPTDGEGGIRAKMAHGYMMGTLISDSWVEALLEDPAAFGRDFIADHCKRELRPLYWSTEPRNRPPDDRPQAFERAMDCGCHSGLTVPIHGDDGKTFGNLTFFHRGPQPDLRELTREHLLDLHSAALYTHTILLARRDSGIGAASGGEAEAALAPRERDCLLGLARGDRTMQIADRLSLSEATINEYVRNARRKLGARTRSEAVARAVLFGLIEP